MKVIKRDGRAVEFNGEKIMVAIEKANMEVAEERRATAEEINSIIRYIESLDKKRILVEDIQDIIEQKLMELARYELAKKYIVYRYTRALVRKQNTTDESILGLIKNGGNTSGKGRVIASVQRDLIAGEVSKDLTKRILLPEKITKAHESGIIHFHDMGYFLQSIINSCVVNMGDMLDSGTEINGQKVEIPNGFVEACIAFAHVVTAVASSQYGKQYINVGHLGKYLRKSYERRKSNLTEVFELNGTNGKNLSDDAKEAIVQQIIEKELTEGIQIIKYGIDSLVNPYDKGPKVVLNLVNDSKSEYSKENEMIIAEIVRQKIKKCELVTEPERAEIFKAEGRFNYGVVSINLLQIVHSIDGDEKEFWNLLDVRLELCYEALMCRHYALLGTISDVSPIHWQNGAIARLEAGERIDRLLKDGYSSISLGCTGVNETAEAMASVLNWSEEATKTFKVKLIRHLEDKVQSWRKMTGIGFEIQHRGRFYLLKKT